MPQFLYALKPIVAGVIKWFATPGILQTVAKLALSYAASAVINKLFAPKLPRSALTSSNPLYVNIDPVAPLPVIYGEVRRAGIRRYGGVSGTNGEYLHLVDVFSCHEVEEIGPQFWLNDEPLIIPAGSNVPAAGTKYDGLIRINVHLGTDAQTADADLVAEMPSEWTTNHRLRGNAYIYTRIRWDQDKFPGGLPNITALVRGKKCYDPRTATTIWTQNPAVCIRDYNTNTLYGLGAATADLDDDTFTAAANESDETVTTNGYTRVGQVTISNKVIPVDSTLGLAPGMTVSGTGIPAGTKVRAVAPYFTGTKQISVDQNPTATNADVTLTFGTSEPRYGLNGTFETSAEPASVLEHMLTTMAGSLLPVDGKWLCHAGAHQAATIVLDEDDLRGPISVQTKDSMRDSFNRVKGTFINPAEKYQPTDFSAVTNATYLTEDGSVERWRDVTLPFVTSHAQAQRLAKIELERNRQDITATLPCKLTALRVQVGDTVQITNARMGWTAKDFVVTEFRFAIESDGAVGCDLTVRETASSVWDWAGGEETLYDPAPNTNLPDPWTVAAPTGLALASGTTHLLASGDGTIVSRILATWTAPADQFVTSGGRIEIEFKKSSDANWSVSAVVAGNTTRHYFAPVEDGTNYDVRILAINSLGVRSTYATVTAHTVIGKTAAPGDPSGLTATGVVEAIALAWTNPSDADLDEIEIWQSNDSVFANGASVAKVDGTSVIRTFAGGAVTRYFWISALDTSGNRSNWVGPASATAQAPDTGPTGPAATYGTIEFDNALHWLKAANGGAWAPNETDTIVTAKFWQNGSMIASRTATVDFAAGVLTCTGGTVSGITLTVTGSGTSVIDLHFVHDSTGAAVNGGMSAVSGGDQGSTGATGDPGANTATVTLYKRATSTPAVPSTTTTYTFATGVLSGTLDGWTQTIPAGSDPLFVTTAVATGTATTDSVLTSDWATVRRAPGAATFFADKDGITTSILLEGDVVFDSTEDNRIYRWNGSTWVDSQKILRMLDLPQIGIGNLIANPDFEDGDVEWTKLGNWEIISDAANAYTGNYVARKPSGANNSFRSTPIYAAKNGDKIYVAVQVKKDASYDGTGFNLGVMQKNAAGGDLTAVSSNFTSLTTSYQAFETIITLNNASTAYVQFYILPTGTHTAGNLFLGYIEARTAITAGLIGANEIIANSANIADAIITSAKIVSLDVAKLNAGTITSKAINIAGGAAGYIQSSNYVAGTTGWRIDGNGGVEFSSGTFRGSIDIGTGTTRTNITSGTFIVGDQVVGDRFNIASHGFTINTGGGQRVELYAKRSGVSTESVLNLIEGTGDYIIRVKSGDGSTTKPRITFGSTEDTTLYRDAANVLKTDDAFHAPSLTCPNTAGQKIILYSDFAVGIESSELRIAAQTSAKISFRVGGYAGTEYAKIDNSGLSIVSGVLKVGVNQVVGTQQSAIASFSLPVFTGTGNYATDSSPLTTAVNNNATKINSILTALRAHGLIAT